jgi:methylglutamate dehydrogenase subunit B
MVINCPHCGPRSSQEFRYRGDATRARPDTAIATAEEVADHLYLRDNPCGEHREHWFHAMGCRSWLVVVRDTLTHAIASVATARAPASADARAETVA